MLDNINALSSHLRDHIDNDESIECPFEDCTRNFKNKSSFNSHIFRNHKRRIAACAEPSSGLAEHYQNDDTVSADAANASTSVDLQLDTSVDSQLDMSADSQLDTSAVSQLDASADSRLDTSADTHFDEAGYTETLALFFLKLQCVYFVPSSTIDMILKELQELTRYANDIWCRQIVAKFKSVLPPDVCDCLTNELGNIDLFQARDGPHIVLRAVDSHVDFAI